MLTCLKQGLFIKSVSSSEVENRYEDVLDRPAYRAARTDR